MDGKTRRGDESWGGGGEGGYENTGQHDDELDSVGRLIYEEVPRWVKCGPAHWDFASLFLV